MPTLVVDVPDHLFRMVEDAIARGEYDSPSAAVSDALCILQYEVATHGEHRATLRREIRKAVIEDDAGLNSDLTIEDIAREVAAEDHRAA